MKSSILTGITIITSLLFLGACQRPRNEMVTAYQAKVSSVLRQQASLVHQARNINGVSASRGIAGIRGVQGFNSSYLGSGYSQSVNQDSMKCILESDAMFSGDAISYANFYPMAFQFMQCLERQTSNSGYALYGQALEYMPDDAQAYMRYINDPWGSGQFGQAYGNGYNWLGMGQNPYQSQDQLLFQHLLTGGGIFGN